MFKALLKKQMLELNSFYFQNKKTGERRTGGKLVGFLALWAMLFLFIMVSLGSLMFLLADGLIGAGFGWLYFALVGIFALLLGTFGSVFNTYAGLYRAKDNELLLSMPIPPMTILATRMVGVYAMSLLYSGLVFLPASVVYLICGGFTVLALINCVLLFFLLGFLVLTLTCLLGFFVALISGKLKNKSIVTVIISLVFFAVYYYFCFNMSNGIQSFIENADAMSQKFNKALPLYWFGKAATGEPLSMLFFTLLVLVLLALTCFVMAKTFFYIANRKESGKTAVYKTKPVKSNSLRATLFKKEWKRFSSSATYMLNSILGPVFMLVGAVAIVIFNGKVRELLSLLTELEVPAYVIPLALFVILLMMLSMTPVSAPSLSLEGQTLWILRTMPVEPKAIFTAKRYLHMAVAAPAALLFGVASGIVLQIDPVTIVLLAGIAVVYTAFIADLGLVLDVRNPNLVWTNETIPVKQSVPVMICLFGGWIFSIVLGGLAYLAFRFLPAVNTEVVFTVILVLLALGDRLLQRYLFGRGVELFSEL